MITPTLTIGLPVYNAMPYLVESVESILNQTYAEFELLIINDGSTDGSAEYLENLADPRIRILHQENLCITVSLNRILIEARTPWLVRHDADDIALANRLEVLHASISKYPDAGMFYTHAKYISDHSSFGTFRSTVGSPGQLHQYTSEGYILSICHPTACLNIEKVKALGGYRFNYHVEDIDLWWRLALKHPIHFIPQTTIGFRLNEESVSSENLEHQAVNSLYIQYLLLSHLWGKQALPYESVTRQIQQVLLDRRKVRFRHHMRRCNIALGKKKRILAFVLLLQAFCSNPKAFIIRCIYECRGNEPALNFEHPSLFKAFSAELWGS